MNNSSKKKETRYETHWPFEKDFENAEVIGEFMKQKGFKALDMIGSCLVSIVTLLKSCPDKPGAQKLKGKICEIIEESV